MKVMLRWLGVYMVSNHNWMRIDKLLNKLLSLVGSWDRIGRHTGESLSVPHRIKNHSRKLPLRGFRKWNPYYGR